MGRWPVTNWLYNNIFGGDAQTQQGQQLDAELQAVNATAYANAPAATQAQVLADETSGDAANTLANAIVQENAIGGNGNGSAGIGSVLTDLFVIGAIGAGIWAFFEFGGVNFLKSLAAKSKWWVVGIVGAVALLAWWLWTEFQQTASDASSTWSGITAGISALNPFSSNS